MKTTKVSVNKYEQKCPECGKILSGFNKKQLEWNFGVHIHKHKKDEKQKS